MKRVTVQFVVPVGYMPGDYALLHGNGGSGAIDWAAPLSSQRYPLYPRGAGLFGFGRAPFGRHRFGDAHASGVPGFGRLPFGRAPFGHGTAVIEATERLTGCGTYKYGLACYDEAGNVHSGTPDEVTIEVHTAPEQPTGLIKNSYNKTTDVLVLDAA